MEIEVHYWPLADIQIAPNGGAFGNKLLRSISTPMSALGHKQTFRSAIGMSAYARKRTSAGLPQRSRRAVAFASPTTAARPSPSPNSNLTIGQKPTEKCGALRQFL